MQTVVCQVREELILTKSALAHAKDPPQKTMPGDQTARIRAVQRACKELPIKGQPGEDSAAGLLWLLVPKHKNKCPSRHQPGKHEEQTSCVLSEHKLRAYNINGYE